jgi:hypothetical protein
VRGSIRCWIDGLTGEVERVGKTRTGCTGYGLPPTPQVAHGISNLALKIRQVALGSVELTQRILPARLVLIGNGSELGNLAVSVADAQEPPEPSACRQDYE